MEIIKFLNSKVKLVHKSAWFHQSICWWTFVHYKEWFLTYKWTSGAIFMKF